MRQVVAVVGPTASGKTALAIELAESLDTEIVSADSMQFYRGMAIGTGAPSAEDLARIPHHFVGFLDPSDEMTASDFSGRARGVVRRLNGEGKTAVVAGGSGLYLRALLDGLFEGPGKDDTIRARLNAEAEESGPGPLFSRLNEIDPDYAESIHENDLRRVVRALEVYELTGKPLSVLHREHRASGVADSLDGVQVALCYPREILYQRIDTRVDSMFERGLVEEVRKLVEGSFEEDLRRLKSLGYREVLSYIKHEISLDEARDHMKTYTRRYAKRQLNWFNADDRIIWLPTDRYDSDSLRVERILSLLDRSS